MPYYQRNLIVLWITTFLTSASWTQVVPFLPLFLEELGVDQHLTQWSGFVFSAQFAAGILMAPLWGKIADQHGRKLMAIRAGICLSVIYFLTGLSTAPWHVLLLRFLNGALTGFIPSSISLVATNTPGNLAARYVASLQTAGATGSVVGPVLGGVLAELFGIRGGLFVSGTAVFLSVLMVILFVEERTKVTGAERTTFRQDIATAFHNDSLLKVMLITILAMLASVSIQPILTVYVGEITANAGSATMISGILFALPAIAFVATAGRWVRLGEKRGYLPVIRIGLVGAGIVGGALWATRNIYLFGLLFFVQGIFIAALRPVSSAIISEEIESSFRGRAFGMQQSAQTFGGLIGPLLAGFFGARFGHASLFLLIGLLLIAGAGYLKMTDAKVVPISESVETERLS